MIMVEKIRGGLIAAKRWPDAVRVRLAGVVALVPGKAESEGKTRTESDSIKDPTTGGGRSRQGY